MTYSSTPGESHHTLRQQHKAHAIGEQLHTSALKIYDSVDKIGFAQQEAEFAERERHLLIEDNPETALLDRTQKITHICMAALVIGSWLVSLLIIFQPAAYLIEQNLGKNNPLVGPCIILFCCLLTAMQVAIAILYFEAKQKNQSLKAWHLAAIALTLFSTGMLFAAETARFMALWQFPGIHDLIALAIKMAMACGLDVLLMARGKELQAMLAFGLFEAQYRRLSHLGRKRRGNIRYHKTELQKLYLEHQQLLTKYRQYAGADAPSPDPFDETTEAVLTQLFGVNVQHQLPS